MAVIADLDALVNDGVLTLGQADVLRARSRAGMITLAINMLLTGGIAAAAGGFVFWLADTVTVAASGVAFLALGMAVLVATGTMWRIFGHAAALIGAGMLIGGGVVEALARFDQSVAGLVFVIAGLVLALVAGAGFVLRRGSLTFVMGCLTVAGAALHLAGLYLLGHAQGVQGLPVMALNLYAALVVAGLGWLLDVRFLTALAIVPFAQALDTGTFYFHAAYVFYSPEATLSILQMAGAIAVCLWIIARRPNRDDRHAGIFAIMAFIVANLCFLVGSLWGDTVGKTFVLTALRAAHPDSWEAVWAGRKAFDAHALHIPDHVFAAIWAVLLAVCAIWAAHTLRRGLFNAAITFGGIHAYTQAFESFGDQPLAWVIGGLAAIPLAWVVWRLNQQFG
ncbi:hypothetical protein [Gemmobacter sp.]|uniref:hypothetical protein n=1 Tax=Gemmobacter sp. TaxID=1898957 RepID=UPI002AFEE4F6|nr:hypothetical protein [Gemmobacter sp.]